MLQQNQDRFCNQYTKKEKLFKTESGLFVQGNYSYVIITKVAFRPSLEQLEHFNNFVISSKIFVPETLQRCSQ
jgi:hypothetical protein